MAKRTSKSKRKKPGRKRVFDAKGIQAFATQLKKVRQQKSFTQDQLAYEAGISLTQVARIETARINPTLSTIFAIARALEMESQLPQLFSFKLPD